MTLEAQYKEFKTKNPDSALTFEEWYESKFYKINELIVEKLKEKKHGFNIEYMYHFFCGDCKELWSLSEYKPSKDKMLTCPHCGFKSNII